MVLARTEHREGLCGGAQSIGTLRRLPGHAQKRRGRCERKKGPSLGAPDPSTAPPLVLLLASLLLRRFGGSIALAETLPTAAIVSFDEARGEVVRAAGGAHELLCFPLALGLVPGNRRYLILARSVFFPLANSARFHCP